MGLARSQLNIATTEVKKTHLGNVAHVDLTLEALHTLVLGLSAHATLGKRALAASTLHTDTVDDISLLGLERNEIYAGVSRLIEPCSRGGGPCRGAWGA
jgi:hypothetical protein